MCTSQATNMSESDTMRKLNKYRNLKIGQAVLWFFLFVYSANYVQLHRFIFGIFMFLALGLDGGKFEIFLQILNVASLICTILSTIAWVLLHFGNKNGNVRVLKAFLVFSCLTYSFFDCCGGGCGCGPCAIVRQRINEIENVQV